MKTRLISGIILTLIGIGAVIGIFTPVFSVLVIVFCTIAAGEIMTVAGVKSNIIRIPAMIFAAVLSAFMSVQDTVVHEAVPEKEIVCLYVIFMMMLMLKTNKQTKFEQLAITLYGSVFVPYAFSGLFVLRNVHNLYPDTYAKADSIYFVLVALFCSFFTDTFAYFVGRKFGKHKMAPVISPKKTVEGAIGGLILSVVFNVAAFAIFRELIVDGNTPISYVFIVVMSVVLSAISMVGDLSASLLKRNFGIKDFGKLMPGHGGVMDRFDSFIFVLPVLTSAIKFINM